LQEKVNLNILLFENSIFLYHNILNQLFLSYILFLSKAHGRRFPTDSRIFSSPSYCYCNWYGLWLQPFPDKKWALNKSSRTKRNNWDRWWRKPNGRFRKHNCRTWDACNEL